jgi:hypothetical protein
MNEQEIRDYAFSRLGDLLPILEFEWEITDSPSNRVDALVRLKLVTGSMTAACEFVAIPNRAMLLIVQERFRTIRDETDWLPLIITPYLSEPLQQHCREAGIAYLDLSGNAWIEHPKLVVSRSSQPSRFKPSKTERNPFADKATLILRHLLIEHQAGGIRAVARATGMNAGYASRVVRSAEDLGFIRIAEDGALRIVNARELLNDWASFYHWKKNRITPHVLPVERGEALLRFLRSHKGYALTMHSGANLLDPFASYHAWHIYCSGESECVEITRHLDVQQSTEGGENLFLLRPYYRSSALFSLQDPGGVPVVSDVQLFLDLRRFSIRGSETAERILVRRILPGAGTEENR